MIIRIELYCEDKKYNFNLVRLNCSNLGHIKRVLDYKSKVFLERESREIYLIGGDSKAIKIRLMLNYDEFLLTSENYNGKG